MKVLMVKCPHCKTSFEYKTSEFRPFCSERCRMIDLGQWLSESYAVEAQNVSAEERDKLLALVEAPDEEQ